MGKIISFKNIFILILLGALVYFPIFYRLDGTVLKMWDEARNAVNALEMSQNGNYLVRYFDGKPDEFETKPPLLVWAQVFFIKLIGANELAVRLPSALSALFLVVLLIYFFKKEFNDYKPGVLASLILITSKGFIGDHVSRTGDHDAMLTLFTTLAVLSFYLFYKYGRTKYLVFTLLGFIAAVFTKSIAPLIFLPGLLIWVLLSGSFKSFLLDKRIYIATGIFAGIILGYYLLREHLQPGYLKLVWEIELFPRYFNTASLYTYYQADSRYYVNNMLDSRFSYWIWCMPLTLISIFIESSKPYRSFILFSLINIFCFMFIISNGSYNEWYDAPVYPWLAMFAGTGIYLVISSSVDRFITETNVSKDILYVFFVFMIFIIPYNEIINKVRSTEIKDKDLKYGFMMKRLEKEKPEYKDFKVDNTGYNAHLLFYFSSMNLDKNYHISRTNISDLKEDIKVLSCQVENIEEIKKKHETELLYQWDNCQLLLIKK
jgi:4-amino-4-deoxy-L-arabinose transferase-like glycosyltransferase